MRNNRILRVLLTAALFSVVLMAVPMTVYAATEPDTTPYLCPEAVYEIDLSGIDMSEILTTDMIQGLIPALPTPETMPKPTPAPLPFTPDGNLTLVDDISGEQATEKQFITVVTKSGNYFYLVIDRVGDKENVYFLNLVDEADLLAILEDSKEPAASPAPTEPAPDASATSAPPSPGAADGESKPTNTSGLIMGLVLIAAIGGVAFFYFKVLKPKQSAAKPKAALTPELEEFDFEPDIEDFDGGTMGAEADEDMPDPTSDYYGDKFSDGASEAGTPESEDLE